MSREKQIEALTTKFAQHLPGQGIEVAVGASFNIIMSSMKMVKETSLLRASANTFRDLADELVRIADRVDGK